MLNKQFNTFSFNNFKPFGEKMQTFTQKPITLIYGPNSVGKSSLLQAELYCKYINNLSISEKVNFSALDKIGQSTTNHFAGDALDFGSFTHFIHYGDSNKSIKYSHTINKDEDLESFFPSSYKRIKQLDKDGVFEFVENKLQTDEDFMKTIEHHLKNYQLNNHQYALSSAIKNYYRTVKPLSINNFKESFMEEYDLPRNSESSKMINKLLLSDDTFAETFHRKDGENLDQLDKYILCVLDLILANPVCSDIDLTNLIDVNYLYIYLDFFKYIATINSITINTKISYLQKNKKLVVNNSLHIDNDLALKIKYIGNGFKPEYVVTLKGKNKFIQKTINYLFGITPRKKNIKLRFSFNEDIQLMQDYDFFQSQILSDAPNALECFIKNLTERSLQNNNSDIQYIGPLRFLPSRAQFAELALKKIKTISKQKYIDNSNLLKIAIEYSDFIYSIDNKYIRNIMENRFMQTFLMLPPLLKVAFKKTGIMKSIKFIHIRNFFIKSRNNKLSLFSAKSSEKMWLELFSDKKLKEQVNKWLGDEEKLKTPYKIMSEEVKKELSIFQKIIGMKENVIVTLFVDTKKNLPVMIQDMGLGISQVLPIIISSIAKKNTKIYLEQPELHLHPAVQAELADEFIRSYKENDNEFMIETHSEHLLLRIMKRMRHTAEDREGRDKTLDLTPDDVCLLYVDSDGENTFVNELELDEDGTLLDPWPNGFFEEGHRERFD